MAPYNQDLYACMHAAVVENGRVRECEGGPLRDGRDEWVRETVNAPGSRILSCHLCSWVERLAVCSVRWNDWALACREWADQFYIYTYIIAIVMLCVCVCVLHMQIRSSSAFDLVCMSVSVHVCTGAIVQHPDVSTASLSVCHWDSRGGVKVTCFKYRQCHDNMPDLTYKIHLHNVSPLFLWFFRLVFFNAFFLLGDRQTCRVSPLSQLFKC